MYNIYTYNFTLLNRENTHIPYIIVYHVFLYLYIWILYISLSFSFLHDHVCFLCRLNASSSFHLYNVSCLKKKKSERIATRHLPPISPLNISFINRSLYSWSIIEKESEESRRFSYKIHSVNKSIIDNQ